MKKNIKINEKENTVTIEVSVGKRNYAKEPIISFHTKDIALLLEKEGIKVETCVENDSIYNDGRNPKTNGKWTFTLKKEKSKQVKKPSIVKEEKVLTTNIKSDTLSKKPKKRK